MRRCSTIAIAGATAAAGATIIVVGAWRLRRRRKKGRVLPRRVRRAVTEVLEMRGQDFLAEGSVGESLFHRRLGRLDDRRLIMLFALAQLGHFVREAGIDPLHPAAEQLEAAVARFASAQRDAPASRDALLEGLEAEAPGSLKQALSAALGILAYA